MTTSVPLHVAIVQIVQFVGARGKRLVVPIGKSELPIMVLSESLAVYSPYRRRILPCAARHQKNVCRNS